LAKYERVVNHDGEVGRFVPDVSNAVIKTPEEIERAKYFATLPKRKRFNQGRNYVVSYNEAVLDVIRDLTLTEAGAMVRILLQLRINSEGRLVKGSLTKAAPMNKSDLAKVLGRSKSNTNALIDRLVVLELIELRPDGIYVNRQFHSMGGRIANEVFTKVYTVKAKEITDQLRLNEIGMLYKIIPFFHYSEYYLCVNPNVDKRMIEYIGRETLAEAIGHDGSTVSKIMGRLQGEGAILVTGTRKEVRYLVHPDLMFRQAEGYESDWTVAVRKLFDDHAKKSRK
jgi:DNA-binding MarR family transcriptional regulator